MDVGPTSDVQNWRTKGGVVLGVLRRRLVRAPPAVEKLVTFLSSLAKLRCAAETNLFKKLKS
jgi:hypothetical protein